MNKMYLGLIIDRYTPKVQAELFRHLMGFQSEAGKWKRELCVYGPPEIQHLLDMLRIESVVVPQLAQQWIVYQTKEMEPDVPDFAKNVEVVRIRTKVERSRLSLGRHTNPGFLREQGRESSYTNLLHRPAPNGYAPVSPAGLAIMFGT